METGATALVSAYQNGGAIGTRWETGNRAHFRTHTAIWAKSKTGNFAKQKCQKWCFDRGGIHLCSFEDLTLVFVTTAQRGVISIAVRGQVWHAQLVRLPCARATGLYLSYGSITGERCTSEIRGVSIALITIKTTAVCIRPDFPRACWTPTVERTHQGIM